MEIEDGESDCSYDDLLRLTQWLEDAGPRVAVLEGSVPITDRVRYGLEGRDRDIGVFERFVRRCGDLDIPGICYDWMAGVRWARTEVHVRSRGDSFVTGFDAAKMPVGPDPPRHSREDLWEGLTHFLQEVCPAAEEAGVKLVLHPDDPPRPEVRGYPQIVTDVEAYERVLDIYDGGVNGVTFCQGNFAAMGVDVPTTIRRLGDRINFVHLRDVDGDNDGFVETWHDDGPTDMFAAMEAHADVGFDGPARPDHVPTMAGEDNSNPGYHTKGRLFAIGYMRGLLEATGG